MDFRKFSRNYQISKSVSIPLFDPVSAKIEGNLVFDPSSYLPKESMLKTTLTVFGIASLDLFEVCVTEGAQCSLPILYKTICLH